MHHDRGRGHGKAEAEHDGAVRARSRRREASAEHERGERELESADADDISAHRPQPRQRQLEADQEQEKQHAELGEWLRAGAIFDGQVAQPRIVGGELAEAVGTDRDPHQEEAEHRAEAGAMKQRNDKPGGGEKDENVLQPGPVVQRGPPTGDDYESAVIPGRGL